MTAAILLSAMAAVLPPPAPAASPAQFVPPATGGTVRVELTSPQDGTTIAPGESIQWDLTVYVSDGDNLGLAMISCDLEQNPNNPQLTNVHMGWGGGDIMREFDAPKGYSNPGPIPELSGFGGTEIGPAGQANLYQIGGAQNTFGRVGPCMGPNDEICMGQDVLVNIGVGQAPQGERVAYGPLRVNAPGTYTFEVTQAFANTLRKVNAAPQASVVRPAKIVISKPTITITVQ